MSFACRDLMMNVLPADGELPVLACTPISPREPVPEPAPEPEPEPEPAPEPQACPEALLLLQAELRQALVATL